MGSLLCERKDLCAMIDDWELWESKEQMAPPEVISRMKEIGLFGLSIPKEYGGKGFSSQAVSSIVKKLSSRSFAVAIIPIVINSLGPGELVLHYETDEAKKKDLLQKIASGAGRRI